MNGSLDLTKGCNPQIKNHSVLDVSPNLVNTVCGIGDSGSQKFVALKSSFISV